ncbi:hypothetical protein J3R83DRAFT_325 [Lanmaoa asiatica]|nr:hypothetical protein J3R83DRAFT_325 [Lanmaoa asiatica]
MSASDANGIKSLVRGHGRSAFRRSIPGHPLALYAQINDRSCRRHHDHQGRAYVTLHGGESQTVRGQQRRHETVCSADKDDADTEAATDPAADATPGTIPGPSWGADEADVPTCFFTDCRSEGGVAPPPAQANPDAGAKQDGQGAQVAAFTSSARLKEGKLIRGCPTSVWSTQVTTANGLPPRPSCIPRTRTYLSSVSVMAASKGTKDVAVKVSTAGLRNPGIAGQRSSVIIGTAKTAGRIKVAETSVKGPVVAGGYRTGTPTRNQRVPPKPIACPYAIEPAFDATWSPPPSPDLSSFPSQSWTVVVDVGVKQIETPTSIKDDGALSGIPSPFPLPLHYRSSPIVVETPASPTEPMVGSDGIVKTSAPTKEPSTEVSHTVCAATIISPSRDGTTSMATLAKVMDRSQVSPPTKDSDSDNRNRMTVRCAVEIARTFFSPSRRGPQSGTETAASKTMGTDVSRIRQLFISPPDKDANAWKNPTTQIEIEMLRARRKVAGGGVVYPRLDRLGSLTAMAIVTKLGASGSDNPSQV